MERKGSGAFRFRGRTAGRLMCPAAQSMAPALRDNWAVFMGSPHSATLLLFQVAGETCAIPAEAVKQVVPLAALNRPPGLPPVLEGFLNLGGTAVPVIRLERLFGLPPQPPPLHAHLVVLGRQEHSFALLVSRALDIVPVAPEGLRPIPKGSTFNECATAEVEAGGRAVPVLSPGRLLLESERQAIAAFQETAQRYLDELEPPSA